MNESSPFEHITDDWYFYSSLNKEARFISHILRGVTWFVCLEFRSGASYDIQLKKDEVEKFLSKFLKIDDYTKEKTEDEIVMESLQGDYSIAEEKKTKQKLKIDNSPKYSPKTEVLLSNDEYEGKGSTPVYIDKNNNRMTEKEIPQNGFVKYDSADKSIDSLPQTLYDTIERLKEGKIKVAEAKEIANLSQTIINCAKVQLDFMKAFPIKK